MKNIIVFVSMLFISTSLLANTKINTISPTTHFKKTIEGYCWTDSIASNRPDAWRCMTGNSIHDPCFATDKKDLLVCDINPLKKNSGFILKLTKPLPESTTVKTAQIIPWMLQLEDGNTCTMFTGTLPMTAKGAISYSCTGAVNKNCDAGLLQDSIREGSTWVAVKIVYCRTKTGAPHLGSVKKVKISQVWQ